MQIITARPILTEETSNCCGMSNFDDEIDVSTNLSDYDDSLGDDMNNDEFSFASGKVKDYFAKQKKDKKPFREEYVTDVLANRETEKTERRTRLAQRREARQLARSERKEARFQRNANRKAKRNSKKLVLIKKQGKERYFFPISRIRLGKKKYKDGSESTIPQNEQVNITAPNGENIVVNKREIARALGVPTSKLTPLEIQRAITVIPQSVAVQQGVNTEVNQNVNEPVIAVNVPDNNVETAGDGELYLTDDLQNTEDELIDVAAEERGLTKNQKIVLWTGLGLATLLLGYVVYKSVTKSN
jgi:hypothetical protein